MENYTKREVDFKGNVFYFNSKGHWHRTDGPAVEWISGTKEWFIDGKRHRKDGPAAEYPLGGRYWFINGKHHRLNGPASISSAGTKTWWISDVEYSKSQHNRVYLFSILEPRRINLSPTENDD
jgi:hypothetical protein